MSTFTPPGPLNTAVLFIAFKRFEESKAVMEGIRAAKPPRLYFACDGARNDKEREEVQRVRDLVKLVDWPCELKTRFSETNQTVKFGPPAAITWFFEHEEEVVGIVVLVPRKLPLNFHDHQIIAVEAADDARLPMAFEE